MIILINACVYITLHLSLLGCSKNIYLRIVMMMIQLALIYGADFILMLSPKSAIIFVSNCWIYMMHDGNGINEGFERNWLFSLLLKWLSYYPSWFSNTSNSNAVNILWGKKLMKFKLWGIRFLRDCETCQ